MKKIGGKIIVGDSSLGYIGLPVDSEIVAEYKSKEVNRFIFSVDGIADFHGAFVPYEMGKFLILLNNEKRKLLKLDIGDDIEIAIRPDDSKYGMPVPNELLVAFEEYPEGDKLFHKLTPGKMRNLIYIVSKYKSSDKRIEKAIVIMDHLIANNGKLDFKMLNEAFKNYKKL